MPRKEVLYLLHFDEPLERDGSTARHYLGHTYESILDQRLQQHLSGGPKAARIVIRALELGRTIHVAKVWDGDFHEESRLKKAGKPFSKICPICLEERKLQELEALAAELSRGRMTACHIVDGEGLIWFSGGLRDGDGLCFVWEQEWGKHKEGRWELSTRDPRILWNEISPVKLRVA